MSAPERIWATGQNAQPSGRWWHETELKNGVEYIRADTVTARISQLEGMVVSGQGEQIRLAADLLQAKIEANTRRADAEAMAEAASRLTFLSATRTRTKPDQADAIIEAATVELAVAVESWRERK